MKLTINVYEFPPSDYLSSCVSLASRYGMKPFLVPLESLFCCTVNSVITFLSTCRDLLMSIESLAYEPVVPV